MLINEKKNHNGANHAIIFRVLSERHDKKLCLICVQRTEWCDAREDKREEGVAAVASHSPLLWYQKGYALCPPWQGEM